MLSRPVQAFLVLLFATACEGPPCPVIRCPSGYECVHPDRGDTLYCAQPCLDNPLDCATPAIYCSSGIRPGDPPPSRLYCPYGTQAESEPCVDHAECLLGLLCGSTQTCQPSCAPFERDVRQTCPDGSACWGRWTCGPRCDLPGGSCPEGLACRFGDCFPVQRVCPEGEVATGLRCDAVRDCDGDGVGDCYASQICGESRCEWP